MYLHSISFILLQEAKLNTTSSSEWRDVNQEAETTLVSYTYLLFVLTYSTCSV